MQSSHPLRPLRSASSASLVDHLAAANEDQLIATALPGAHIGIAPGHGLLGSVHPRLEALFYALDREAVAWSLLRGESRLDSGGGDVDLLVAEDAMPRLRRVAMGIGFAHLPAWGYGSHVFFLTYDAGSDVWLKLDVVTDLAFGPYFAFRTKAAAEALERRVRIGRSAVFRLADDDAFWALALHCCLDKRAVAADEAARLRELVWASRTAGPLVRSLGAFVPPGWTDRVIEKVEPGDWSGFVRDGDALAARWTRRRPAARAWMVAGRLTRRADAVRRRVRPRGLLVALVGPKGDMDRLALELTSSIALPARVLAEGDRRDGLRIRRLRGGGLVLISVRSLDELRNPPAPSRRWPWAPLGLSSVEPDLVIGLHPQMDGGTGTRPAGFHVVDPSVRSEDLRRTVSTIIWQRLVTRWNGPADQAKDQ